MNRVVMINFFRHQTDGFVFPMYSRLHVFLLIFTLIGTLWVIRQAELHEKLLRRLLCGALIIIQLLQYGWFFSGGPAWIIQGLPLYHCRIAELAMVSALLNKKDSALNLSVYLGGYGAPVALLLPVMEAFSFPHITNIAYFANHILMVWTVAFLVRLNPQVFQRKNYRQALLVTNLMNLFILVADHILKVNYAYFLFSPVLTKQFQSLPYPVYVLFAFIVYNLAVTVIYVAGRLFYKKQLSPSADLSDK